MPLSIKNIPPVGSHVCCVFIGFFLANMSHQPQTYIDFSRYSIILNLPKTLLSFALPGEYVYLGKKKKERNKSYCFFKSIKARVLKNKNNLIIACDRKDTKKFLLLYTNADYSIVTKKEKGKLGKCGGFIQITYGSQNYD
jgi:hypothetical protein